jgi:hypothetical protein
LVLRGAEVPKGPADAGITASSLSAPFWKAPAMRAGPQMSGKGRTLSFDPGPTNAGIGPDSPTPGRSTNAEDAEERTAEAL